MKKALLFGMLFTFYQNGFAQNPITVITKKQKGIELVQKDSLFSMRFQLECKTVLAICQNHWKILHQKVLNLEFEDYV